MPLESVYIRSDAVVARMIGGETLAIPVRGGIGDLASIYRFNEIGTMIWNALAKPMNLQELVVLIESDYEASMQRICDDVAFFLDEMNSAGLVTVCKAEGAMDAANPKTDQNSPIIASPDHRRVHP